MTKREKGWLARASEAFRAAESAPDAGNATTQQDAVGSFNYYEQLNAAKTAATDTAYAELMKRRQEFTDAAVSEHSADVAAYRFDCRRYGDFLSLFVERISNGNPKFSTSINLATVTTISLASGTAPGIETVVPWAYQYTRSDGVSGYTASCWPLRIPGENETLVAHGFIGAAKPGRRHPWASAGEKRDEDWAHGNGSYFMDDKTMPGAAVDDQVRFDNTGCALLIPFGEGQRVHDRIMAEMADFYPKEPK